MKHLKKVVIAFTLLTLLSASFMPNVSAGTSDTFNITVTGEYIWIDILNASWTIGTVLCPSSTWTNETNSFIEANMSNCSVAVDLKLQITSDAADWTSAAGAADPGADVYRLNASDCDPATPSWVPDAMGGTQVIVASATTIEASLAAGNDQLFDLRFDAPTTTSSGDEQTITVTASLVKS